MLHSGHIAFLNECAKLGAVTVVVGSDHNFRELRGGINPVGAADATSASAAELIAGLF